MSEAARPHPAIPLSPPSPPADGVKEGSKPQFSEYTPNSPTSPFMSIATKSYGRTFADTHSSTSSSRPEGIQRSPSPPTSAPMSTQVSQQPSVTVQSSFPTPENSVIGQTRKALDDLEEDHAKKRQRLDEFAATKGGALAHHDADSRSPTQSKDLILPDTNSPLAELSNRPAASELSRGANMETLPGSYEMSLEQLQKNVGEVFHLCKSAIPRIRPDPGQHLLSTYGLSDLHSKVARTAPVSHEKINKLRRSYEGHIKTFALAGRNKPVKDEIPEGQWSSLNMMMLEPDESWYASKVIGKKIEITPGLESRLHKALALQPGRTKDHDQWDDSLGHEKPKPIQIYDASGKKAFSAAAQRPQINGNAVRSVSQATGEAARPRRSGKKRSYADSSFEGYGDGFVDDEAVDLDRGFVSNSEEGSHGPGRKKRRKDHSFSSSTSILGGGSSYGVGGWNGGDR